MFNIKSLIVLGVILRYSLANSETNETNETSERRGAVSSFLDWAIPDAAKEKEFDDVVFYLYPTDEDSSSEPHKLQLSDFVTSYARTNQVDEVKRQLRAFNASRPTVMVTHGHGGNLNDLAITTIRQAYASIREERSHNVIAVQWSKVASLFYPVSLMYVKEVGAKVAKMIDKLFIMGIEPDSVTLIGHSLGAHVMASAGKQASRTIGRIVGLDPAGPLVESSLGIKLSRGDAKLVEVVHTCGSLFGLKEPVGDVDFYPNGGEYQPGCKHDYPRCDHWRAYSLYAEAIQHPESLVGVRCVSYESFLKGDCKKTHTLPVAFGASSKLQMEPGQYYFRTNDKKPFGLGLKGIKPT